MPSKEIIKNFRDTILPGVFNSYSIIFFQTNKLLAVVIMVVSFFNFFAGLSGLYAVLFTLLIGNAMQLDKTILRTGIYSFNALLTGLGMGTFFEPGIVFFSLLTLAVLLSLFLSVTMGGWLYKYNLPHLSIPFVVSIWFILLPSQHFENLGLSERNIFWINEMYSIGGNSLLSIFQSIDEMSINHIVDIYLRSLSSIFFQNNLISGILIAIALFLSSRIFFSLSIVGFLSAYLFAQFSGSEVASINYYNIGANYMMVAFAVGGFFMIPSKKSYLWAILLVPLTSLVLLFFYKLFGYIQMPVFSLPFSFVVILFIYFLQMRTKASTGLVLTPLQNYSPEINLYTYNNNKDRLARWLYYPIRLPFWGEWVVTQGHDGEYTHIGEWGKAFDFMIFDGDNNSFRGNGLACEDYYCYNKAVIAPADGIVELIVDDIDDNEIGKVDTLNNWGNSIIIKHAAGLYSQLSHLKKGSAKVKVGDVVKSGDVLAHCGNSGRSPQPHLHFQLQAFPILGSKTIDYPIAYYFRRKMKKTILSQFSKPLQYEKVINVSYNPLLKHAFDISPNSKLAFSYHKNGIEVKEYWEAYTDAYNHKYLYCSQTKSAAYYVNDGFMFYFTAFYGDKKSLLYYFYLSAYKVFLGNENDNQVVDSIPLSEMNKNRLAIWLQDIIAPFYNYLRIKFTMNTVLSESLKDADLLKLKSTVESKRMRKNKVLSKSLISIDKDGIREIRFESESTKIEATCIRTSL